MGTNFRNKENNSSRSNDWKEKQDLKNDQGDKNNEQNNDKKDKPRVERYVGAPYNFVSLSDTVYTPYEQLISHGEMNEELLNGEIEYTLTAETPIFVDSGIKNGDKTMGAFHRNGYGEYSIPGSTMRGLIRNNVQILGLSSVGEDIDDYSLMYRRVGTDSHDPAKKPYEKRLGSVRIKVDKDKEVNVLKNVSAGYIFNKKGQYYIYQTKLNAVDANKLGKMNYYVVREKTVVDAYMKAKEKGKTFAYDFFAKRNIMQNDITVKYKKVKETAYINGKETQIEVWRGRANKEYVPYFEKVCYEVSKKNCQFITRIAKPTEENLRTMKNGYVMSTGFMDRKQVFYIIPEIDVEKKAIRISESDLKCFQIDYNKRESKLGDKDSKEKDKKKKAFFQLPEEGMMKPVFYINLQQKNNNNGINEHTYFGFTPRLRIFYDHTIAHGIKAAHINSVDKIDYAKALFGFTGDENSDSVNVSSYKSRLSFADAVIEGDTKELPKVVLTLGNPSPTSFFDYLVPSNQVNEKGKIMHPTYNDDFEIRGIKQYWLHDGIVYSNVPESKTTTAMKPLPKDTKFKGKIRFKNLTKDELGLLLWSVRLEKDSSMNVGKAKSYGYGRIKVSDMICNVIDLEKAYATGDLNTFMEPYRCLDIDETIQYYKKHLKEHGKIDINLCKNIKEFFAMKDGSNLPDKKDIAYMRLADYKKRKGRALPSVNQVLEKKE